MPFDKPIVILHVWSDKSVTFEPIATFLRQRGAQVVDLYETVLVEMILRRITVPEVFTLRRAQGWPH